MLIAQVVFLLARELSDTHTEIRMPRITLPTHRPAPPPPACVIKPTIHDADADTDTDFLVRILADILARIIVRMLACR